jgi:hypothetical protein
LIKTFSGPRGKISKLLPFNGSDIILLDGGGRLLIYSLLKNEIKALPSSIEIKSIVTGFLQEV